MLEREALRAATDGVFSNLIKATRFEGNTRADNIAMRRTFESCGWVNGCHQLPSIGTTCLVPDVCAGSSARQGEPFNSVPRIGHAGSASTLIEDIDPSDPRITLSQRQGVAGG